MGLQHLMEMKEEYLDFEIDGILYKAKELNGKEYMVYQSELFEMKGDKKVYHLENVQDALIYASLCDAEGIKVFKKSDKVLIGKLPQHVIKIIWEAVTEVNGMNEDIEKN